MERYLLFDSESGTCTKLAQEIAHETEGWLVGRSLRDPEMQRLLEQARPHWRWEPTLLECDGNAVHVFTRLQLQTRLALGVGPARAWRVAQIVKHTLASGTFKQDRRQLIKTGGVLGVAFLIGEPLRSIGTVALDATTANSASNNAKKARTLMRDAPDMKKLESASADIGLHAVKANGSMKLKSSQGGQYIYEGDKHTVLYAGELENEGIYQVALGFEETGDARKFSFVLGYVNFTTSEVSRITRVDVASTDDRNGVVRFTDAQGRVTKLSVTDGRAAAGSNVTPTARRGSGLFAPPAQVCGSTLGCWIAEQVACGTLCFAVAGASGGILGVPCAIICSAGFLWLCSYAPC